MEIPQETPQAGIPQTTKDAVFGKVVQLGGQFAFRFNKLKEDLEHIQAGRFMAEIVALIYLTGGGDLLGQLMI